MLTLRLDTMTMEQYADTLVAIAGRIRRGLHQSGCPTELQDGQGWQYGTICILLDSTKTDGFGA